MPETSPPDRPLHIHVSAPLPAMAERVARALANHVTSVSLAPDARAALLRARSGLDPLAVDDIVGIGACCWPSLRGVLAR